MRQAKKEYGAFGEGHMMKNLTQQALSKGMRVVVCSRSQAFLELVEAGLVEIKSFAGFKTNLAYPRVVFIHIPANLDIDSIIDELALHLEPGDIVVDGSNSYWGDSIQRHERLRQSSGIHFVDLGISGGVEGSLYGACFMVGGDIEAVAIVEPILKELAIPGGYLHAGSCGAGHFTKLVHNGIKCGMLHAIAEGIDLLEHHQEQLNIAEILRCWCHGSEIRSFLLDLLEEAYDVQKERPEIPASDEDTSKLRPLVNDALKMEVSVPVISQAIMQQFALHNDKKYWVRAITIMLRELDDYP